MLKEFGGVGGLFGMLDTDRHTVRVVCDCGASFEISVIRVINSATHPELLDSLLSNRINLVHCTYCGAEFPADTPIYVNDPRARRYACCFPSAWRSEELQLRIRFYQELLGHGQVGDVPPYLRSAHFVFGSEACAHLLQRSLPTTPFSISSLQARAETPGPTRANDDDGSPLPQIMSHAGHAPADKDVKELDDADFEQVADADPMDVRDAAMIQRWRESGQNHYTFIDEGALHIFQRHAEPEQFGNRADVFFQLQRTENFPLIVLVLVATGQDGQKRVLTWLFNLDNHIDVTFLEALSVHFEIRLHLFDEAYRRHGTLTISQSLEENVAYVLEEARRWMEQIEPGSRNFFIAASKLDTSQYTRLGGGSDSLDADAFRQLPTAATTRLALDILTFWSSRKNYEYLIFIKSFPVARFQTILTEVLRRAVHFGLVMTEKMKRICLEMKLVNSRSELITLLLAHFARTTRIPEEDDLEPQARVDNWRRLMQDAEMAGVAVGRDILERVQESERLMRESRDTIPLDLADGIELFASLDQLEQEELVDLLGDENSRVEAMRTLARAGQADWIPAVLETWGRLTRGELEALGSDLAGFGQPIAAAMRDMVASGKAHQRLSALRTLARLQAKDVGRLLIHEVVAGSRDIWRACVDLVAGLDAPPVGTIIEASSDVRPAVRKRMVAALAAVADPACRKRLGELADGDSDNAVRSRARRMYPKRRHTKILSNDDAL